MSDKLKSLAFPVAFTFFCIFIIRQKMATQNLTVSAFPAELKERAMEKAIQEERSLSSYIRLLIKRDVEKWEANGKKPNPF